MCCESPCPCSAKEPTDAPVFGMPAWSQRFNRGLFNPHGVKTRVAKQPSLFGVGDSKPPPVLGPKVSLIGSAFAGVNPGP